MSSRIVTPISLKLSELIKIQQKTKSKSTLSKILNHVYSTEVQNIDIPTLSLQYSFSRQLENSEKKFQEGIRKFFKKSTPKDVDLVIMQELCGEGYNLTIYTLENFEKMRKKEKKSTYEPEENII